MLFNKRYANDATLVATAVIDLKAQLGACTHLGKIQASASTSPYTNGLVISIHYN